MKIKISIVPTKDFSLMPQDSKNTEVVEFDVERVKKLALSWFLFEEGQITDGDGTGMQMFAVYNEETDTIEIQQDVYIK